jgi:hypothetical protein
MKVVVLSGLALLLSATCPFAADLSSQSVLTAIDTLPAAELCPASYLETSIPQEIAQSVAILGPTGNAAVVDRCSQVAQRQLNDDHSFDGQCIGSVRVRMESQQALVSPAELDQIIADLVPELAAIAQLQVACTCIDTEIAEAIALAESYSSSEEQAALLRGISATIRACDTEVTAAVDFGLPPEEGTASPE